MRLLLEEPADLTGDERLTVTSYPVDTGAFITSLPGDGPWRDDDRGTGAERCPDPL